MGGNVKDLCISGSGFNQDIKIKCSSRYAVQNRGNLTDHDIAHIMLLKDATTSSNRLSILDLDFLRYLRRHRSSSASTKYVTPCRIRTTQVVMTRPAECL